MNYFFDTEFVEGFHKPLFGRNRHFIELISIGIVAEDGREYYAINKDMDLKSAWNNEWVRENVIKPMWLELYKKQSVYAKTYHDSLFDWNYKGVSNLIKWNGKPISTIRNEIVQFVFPMKFDVKHTSFVEGQQNTFLYSEEVDNPQFYAYYADYDWVVLCSIFGKMIDLPEGFPMYCRDLKQMMDDRGLTKEWKRNMCPDPVYEHNALADAKWNLKLYNTIGFTL